MRKLILIVFLQAIVVQAQAPDTLWTRTYGGNLWDEARMVKQTFDGGYVIAGASLSFGGLNSNFYLVKTDADGDTLWTGVYGGQLDAVAVDVVQTPDKGYAIAGSALDLMYLVKTDSLGNELWTREYPTPTYVRGQALTTTPENGFIIAGWNKVPPPPPNPYYGGYAVKTDSLGNTIWARHYRGNHTDYIYSVDRCPGPGGGYVLAGSSSSNPNYDNDTNWDAFIFKIAENGDTIWTRYYGTPNYGEESYSAICAPDGRIMVAGNLFNTRAPVAALLCLNQDGDSLWTASWPPPFWPNEVCFANAVALAEDGGYFVSGYKAIDLGYDHGFVAKIDHDGQHIWTKIIENQSHFYAVQATSDGGAIMAGRIGFSDTCDYYVVKLASENMRVEDDQRTTPSTISLSPAYPNPFNAQTTIRYTLSTPSDVSIDIFDITGRKIETIVSEKQEAGEHQAVWDAAGRSSGAYFYRIKAGDATKTEKCVLLK